jgi:2-amino-4-hydroxy-6-hydroxymethyldihydropteridine diphosphokinase
MNTAYIIIGGNLGDRKHNLQHAIHTIKEKAGIVNKLSSIYETEPWGVLGQPDYYNQVIELGTHLDAVTLMNTLQTIETEMGRQRTTKYNSRNIDIDILFFNNDIIHTGHLQIPHPRLHLRKFVLIPLAEIAPEYIHPVLNKSIRQLIAECIDKAEVKKIADF